MSLSLEHLQAHFAAALLDDAVPLHGVFVDAGERLSARMRLYRRGVFDNWRRALAAAFPVVHALIGGDCFTDVARGYAASCRSVSGDLNQFGAEFAEFVSTCPATSTLAYLGDVAALEWSVHRAHYATDAAPVRRERIVAFSAGELLSSHFGIHPACAWMTSAHAVSSIWLAHQTDAVTPLSRIAPRAESALITRRHWRVSVREITRGDVAALDALRNGADMDEAIATALRADAAFDFGKAFVRWLDDNVLVDAGGQ